MVNHRSIDWLSQASDDPDQFRMIWRDDPRVPQLVAAGALFAVLVTDQKIGIETLDQLRRRDMPVGAVTVDRAAGLTGFFLPAGTRALFERTLTRETNSPPSYRFLSEGSYVVLPGPMPWPSDRFGWLNPLARPQHGSPLQAVALGVMLAASARLIACADRYGEETAHVRS
jgi:Bifunctional DNA primase/polymerase, N-terminal